MELHDFLLAAVYLLATTAVCVTFFKRLGLGSLLGLLIGGVIVGPYNPGPVATE
jgi:glutathione-regulated potassium-efflux system ancillary protein KefC